MTRPQIRRDSGTSSSQGVGTFLCGARAEVFTITEKAPTRAFPWLKAPTSVFTIKKLLKHYTKQNRR